MFKSSPLILLLQREGISKSFTKEEIGSLPLKDLGFKEKLKSIIEIASEKVRDNYNQGIKIKLWRWQKTSLCERGKSSWSSHTKNTYQNI